MSLSTLRIATRKSALALWQAEHVAARLRALHPGLAVELVPMGEHEFFMREKDATLRFDANGDQPVDTITFIDGRPRPGKRIGSGS